MSTTLLLAFIPLLGWAFGDYFIQKTVRKVSVIQSLFYICLATIPLLLPFIYSDLLLISSEKLFSLCGIGVLVFIYAVIQFRAMQIGKLSVIETIIGLELPMTVLIAIFIGKEVISGVTLLFVVLISLGVLFTSMKDLGHLKIHRHIGEKGVLLALAASVLSAFANFLIGSASQQTSPLLSIFIIHGVVAILCFLVLIFNGQLKETYTNIFKFPKIIFLQTLFDNVAWIGYAFLVISMPISLAITFSESYIVLAAFLGYYFNNEKLNLHQKIAMVFTFVAVIVLSILI